MTAKTALAKYVYAAAKALDKIKRSWANEINTGQLNMTSSEDCILGQLFGGYATGLDKISQHDFPDFNVIAFAEPGARPMWEREIRKRLRKNK